MEPPKLKLSNLITNIDTFQIRLITKPLLYQKYLPFSKRVKSNTFFDILSDTIYMLLDDVSKNEFLSEHIVDVFDYTYDEYILISSNIKENKQIVYKALFEKLTNQKYKLPKERFIIKKAPKELGRFSSFNYKLGYNIYLDNLKQKIGYITKLEDNAFNKYGENNGKIAIKFSIKNDKNSFDWVTLKRKFDSFDEAFDFLMEPIIYKKLISTHNFYLSLNESQNFLLNQREFSTEEREILSKSGKALPDGSYPIENKKDLSNAIHTYGLGKNHLKAKEHIIKRAKALGAIDMIPQKWIK